MVRRTLGIAAAAALLWSAPEMARADTVTLKNGREIHGRLVEERVDAIRIRTVGGTITIAKSEVATFTENDNFGSDYARPETGGVPTPPASGGGATGGGSTEGATGGGSQAGGAATGAPTGSDAKSMAEGWTWGPDVTDEQKEALTPKRDALFAELEKLGAPAEERLAKLELSGEEEQVLSERIQAMAWRRRQGSANLRRQNAKDRLIQEFGVKAIPRLVTSLGSDNQWIARMSAQALGELAKGGEDKEERRWLMYHFDAPGGLIKLLDHQGEVDSPFIRQEANAALEAITGASHGFQASTESLRTPAESRTYEAWRGWWSTQQARWKGQQEQAAQRREAIAKELDAIRQGRDPVEESERG